MDDVIPEGFFVDAVNPTDEEIVRWAYIPDAHYPPEMSQDWDLMAAEPRRADLFERLASDPACPNRAFFLSCLYLMVGDAVRSKGAYWSFDELQRWLNHERAGTPAPILLFLQRAKDLVQDPGKFDYNKWCWSGYAYGIDDDA